MFRKNSQLKFGITVLLAAFCLQISAQGAAWDIPADKKAKNSYLKFDEATTKEGASIYVKNCASCHGTPGKGDVMKTLSPIPPDLSKARTQELTDGELFYILNVGRGVMPSFKNVLSENDRWKTIAYIRSFHKGYVQVLSKTDPNKSKLVKVDISYDAATNKVKVVVKANEKAGVVSLKDAEVALFADRLFGKLQIDKTVRATAEGVAEFSFPTNLPGDKVGNVGLTVKINDEIYGEIESQKSFKIGIPTDKPSLREKRAIWNTVVKAPYWILITYTTCVLIVLAFFAYILLGLKKLKESGEEKKDKETK